MQKAPLQNFIDTHNRMKKIFSFRKPISRFADKKDSKISNGSTRNAINLVVRTPDELSKSRCKAYSYLVP